MEQVISQAEWQVMRVIWAHAGASSQEIIAFLQEGFDWQATTIKTLLGRLRKKGYLQMQKENKKYRYYPLVTEEEQVSSQLATLLATMCSTKHAHLLAACLEAGDYSRADLDWLTSLLLQKRETAPSYIPCHCLAGQCTCGHHKGVSHETPS